MMIYNIQVLRAVAALLVLFPHLGTILKPTGWSEDAMVFGQFGVDLFFVISGFVMVHTSRLKPQSPAKFMLNRIVRVAPLYWLLTVVTFVLAMVVPHMMSSTVADPVMLAKSLGFIPFVKHDGMMRPLLHVGWTLNYEMYFYAIFAIAIALSRGVMNRIIMICCAVLAVQSAARLFVSSDETVAFFYTDSLMLEFCFGMILAWLFQHGRVRMATGLAVPLMLVSAVVLLGHRYVVSTGDYRTILAGLPSVAILAAAISLEQAGHALTGRRLQLLGAASYSLYLSHPFVAQIFGKVSTVLNSAPLAYLTAVVSLITSVVVAIYVYRFVERPMTVWLRGLLREREPIAQRAAAAYLDASGRRIG